METCSKGDRIVAAATLEKTVSNDQGEEFETTIHAGTELVALTDSFPRGSVFAEGEFEDGGEFAVRLLRGEWRNA